MSYTFIHFPRLHIEFRGTAGLESIQGDLEEVAEYSLNGLADNQKDPNNPTSQYAASLYTSNSMIFP